MEITGTLKSAARDLTMVIGISTLSVLSGCLGPTSPSGIRLSVEERVDQGYGISREKWDKNINLRNDFEVIYYYCDGKRFKVAVYNRRTGELFVDKYMRRKYGFEPTNVRPTAIIPSINSGIEGCLREAEQKITMSQYQF